MKTVDIAGTSPENYPASADISRPRERKCGAITEMIAGIEGVLNTGDMFQFRRLS